MNPDPVPTQTNSNPSKEDESLPINDPSQQNVNFF